MKNILLVDDELLHLKGLSHILTENYPDIILHCADNVSSALKLLDTYKIEIIVTDIEMPVFSGFDLIQEIHKKSQKSKIIIISAHDKFSYAQQAVELGVIAYILKPFSTDTVTNAINKALKILSNEQNIQEKELQLHKQLSTTMPVYISHILNKLVYSTPSDYEWDFFHDVFTFSNPFLIILSHFSHTPSEEDIHEYPLFIRQALYSFGKGLSFLCEKDSNTFCTIFQISVSKIYEIADIASRLSSLSYKNYHLSFEVSQIYSNFPTNFSEEFLKLLLWNNFHYFSTIQNVLITNGTPPEFNESFQVNLKTVENLLDSIKNQNEKQALYLTSELFHFCDRSFFPKKESFLTAILSIMEEVFSVLYRIDNKTEYQDLYNHFSLLLYETHSVMAAQTLFINTVKKVIYYISQVSDNNIFLVMDDCMQFIQEHYMENLSLDSISSKYHFNASYFSTLFHTCTNQNFSEYLTQIRLSKSIELLVKTNYKIYEISKSVGYNDSTYFNRVFKKAYGVSPEKYRKLNKKENNNEVY